MNKKYEVKNTRTRKSHIVENLSDIPDEYLELQGDGNPFLMETDKNCGDSTNGVEMCFSVRDDEYVKTETLTKEELYSLAIVYINDFSNIEIVEIK